MQSVKWYHSLIACPVLLLVATVMLVTALATTHWTEVENQGHTVFHGGLFRACFNDTCTSYDDLNIDTASLKVTMGCCIPAAIAYAVGCLASVQFVWTALRFEKPSFGFIVISIAGCSLNIAGIRYWSMFLSDNDRALYSDLREAGYSYPLAWVPIIFVVVGGLLPIPVIMCFAKPVNEETNPQVAMDNRQ